MADNKGLIAIIAVIVLVLIVMQLPKINLYSKLPSIPQAEQSILQSKKQFRQVEPLNREISGFHIITTGADASFCCDSSCQYSCVGTYDNCNAWCDTKFPHEKLQCPSGYTLISGTEKCCPTSNPYYCSTNNLCYAETNCGQGTLGEVQCRQGLPVEGYVLFRKEIVKSVAKRSQCIQDRIEGCGTSFGGTTDDDCLCYLYAWNANEIANELIKQFPYNELPFCNSCSGNLCVRNNRCQLGEVRCSGANNYYACETIKPNYFASSFNDYSTVLKTCPTGTICNVNRCEKDSDGDGFPDSLDQCPNNAPTERVNKFGCPLICGQNEVKLTDGTCKQLVQTCIDNNLNNICDLDDPIVWADPTNNVPICADRNGDRICDGVEGLFCKDSNNNKICDSDEIKWLSTYCLDVNGNGICDGIETTKAVCDKTIAPVCDLNTNITYPNLCFANAYNVIATVQGSCKVSPVIIRRDCATGDVPIPSGYICDFETGWLFKREVIYINIDCRGKQLEGYTCAQVGEDWIWTKTEFVNIDCYSRGCPKPNQLCQGGICVESSKRCPMEIDCKAVFGSDSTCDEEIGLCTKIQFKPVQPTPPETKGFFASIPLPVKIIGGIVIFFILLRLF